jgi:MFS family permease
MRALLRQRDYMAFWTGRVASAAGTQIQSVALGWQVYVVARKTLSVPESAFWVGMLGLASFIPIFLLALPGGEAADRYDRKVILQLCAVGQALNALVLAIAVHLGFASLPMLLVLAGLFGVSRAFANPASGAIAPMLVPRSLLPRAIAWNSLGGRASAILAPAIGGTLVAVSPAASFGVATVLYLVSLVSTSIVAARTKPEIQPGSRWDLVKEGLAYVWNTKMVAGSISLDMFAVLLGGATALLPVFAKDVLHAGPQGFGILRAAPAIGGMAVAMYLAGASIKRHAGPIMLGGVAVFGAMTVVFGLSTYLPLSAVALAVLGGADMLSVYVRQTLVQIVTPDHMRGRVAAVSSLFISASNELGEFESGVAARFLGPVGAAVFGGLAAIGITGLWAKIFPDLRKADRLE